MNHLPGECPTLKSTCCLCEGGDHVPSQCPLSPLIAASLATSQKSNRPCKQKVQEEISNPVNQPDLANMICFECGQKGHFAANCPNKKKTTPTLGRGAPRGSANITKGRLNHVKAEKLRKPLMLYWEHS